MIWLLNYDYWTIDNPINKKIFVYMLIYMDFISELLFFYTKFRQNFRRISWPFLGGLILIYMDIFCEITVFNQILSKIQAHFIFISGRSENAFF